MKKAIISGATGFIGCWLTRELISHEYNVTLLVRDKNKVADDIRSSCRVIVFEGNFENVRCEPGYDVFYHLAWDGVSSDKKNDIDRQLNNISIAINAMKLAKKLQVKKMIVAGTVAEYVFCEGVMDLNAKQTPNDFYGAAKVSAHYFLDVLSRQLDQPYIYIVLPSTYGEGRKDDNILTYTIKMLLQEERPIYGDLEQLWDFVYVSDVVCAIRLLSEKGQVNKTYGIGSGEYRTLKEYVTHVRDIINPKLELGIGEFPQMSNKTFSSCVSTYEIIKDIGFRPQVSFDVGIRRMIEYFRNGKDD